MTAKEKATSWLDQNIDTETRTAITALLSGEPEALEDAFYKDLEFGTGGMRGVMGVGSNRVNKYTLGTATQGLANYLKRSFPNEDLKVAIAHDCRNNSQSLAKLVADVLTANGVHTYLFTELRPTPQLSFAVRQLGCQSGIVITASHNPPEYNGYKVYWNDGAQVVAPHDKGIIDEVQRIRSLDEVRFEANESLLTYLDSGMDEAFLSASLQQRVGGSPDKNLSIVFTSLHGTSITLMPELFKRAGYPNFHVVDSQAKPDGNFPTVASPNPEEREALNMALEMANDLNAEVVLGTDPDSDRIGVAVRGESGDMILLNGNQCGVLITNYLLEKAQAANDLRGNEFIAYTIVSSDMFRDVAEHYNTQWEVCLTGFKHIASLIRKYEGQRRFVGGGEESYGYMIGDFVRDKDALTSALLFCDMAAEQHAQGSSAFEKLKQLYQQHGFYIEHLISITKKGREGAQAIADIMERFRSNPPVKLGGEAVVRIDDIKSGESMDVASGQRSRIDLPTSNVLQFFTEGGSKISARPSGTEPKIKFYFSVKAPWQVGISYAAQEKILKDRIAQIVEDLGLN